MLYPSLKNITCQVNHFLCPSREKINVKFNHYLDCFLVLDLSKSSSTFSSDKSSYCWRYHTDSSCCIMCWTITLKCRFCLYLRTIGRASLHPFSNDAFAWATVDSRDDCNTQPLHNYVHSHCQANYHGIILFSILRDLKITSWMSFYVCHADNIYIHFDLIY